MRQDEPLEKRHRLLRQLPITGEILRGSLLSRAVRPHRHGCSKCASGEGHPLWVLTISYPAGRTRQFSLHPDQVPEVRRRLSNYRNLKDAIEEICELNHELLRRERDARRAREPSA
jgi:hypothetical protein